MDGWDGVVASAAVVCSGAGSGGDVAVEEAEAAAAAPCAVLPTTGPTGTPAAVTMPIDVDPEVVSRVFFGEAAQVAARVRDGLMVLEGEARVTVWNRWRALASGIVLQHREEEVMVGPTSVSFHLSQELVQEDTRDGVLALVGGVLEHVGEVMGEKARGWPAKAHSVLSGLALYCVDMVGGCRNAGSPFNVGDGFCLFYTMLNLVDAVNAVEPTRDYQPAVYKRFMDPCDKGRTPSPARSPAKSRKSTRRKRTFCVSMSQYAELDEDLDGADSPYAPRQTREFARLNTLLEKVKKATDELHDADPYYGGGPGEAQAWLAEAVQAVGRAGQALKSGCFPDSYLVRLLPHTDLLSGEVPWLYAVWRPSAGMPPGVGFNTFSFQVAYASDGSVYHSLCLDVLQRAKTGLVVYLNNAHFDYFMGEHNCNALTLGDLASAFLTVETALLSRLGQVYRQAA